MTGVVERIAEAISPRKRMEARIARSRDYLRDVARGSRYSFEPGEEFSIDPKSGKATYNIKFYLERGYSESQVNWALTHELRDHLVEHDKLVSTRGGEAALQELASRETTIPWLHIWRNCREDAAGNMSIAEYIAPSLHPDAQRLYRKKLFPNRDFQKLPRHLQFSYAVLTQTMLPNDTGIKVSPEVQEVLNRLHELEFIAPDGTRQKDVIGYVTRGDDLYDASELALCRLQMSQQYIEPEIARLFQEDQSDPKFSRNSRRSSGDQGQDSSSGQFEKYYKDYRERIHPEPLEEAEKRQIEKEAREEEQRAENQKAEEEATKAQRQKEDADSDKKAYQKAHGLSDHEMSVLEDYQSVYKEVSPHMDALRKVFYLLVEKRRTLKRSARNYQQYGRLTATGLHKEFVLSRRGIKHPPTRKNITGESIKQEVLPNEQTWHIVFDQSSSMEGEKAQAQRRAAVLYMEVLWEFEQRLKSMQEVSSGVDLEIHSDARGFGIGSGNELRIYKTLSEKMTPKKRAEVFEELLITYGSTNDYDALEQIAQEFSRRSEAYRKYIKDGQKKEIVVVLSDGESNTPSVLKDKIRNLRDKGITVIGLGVTKDGQAVIENYEPDGRVCYDVSDLPKALSEILLPNLQALNNAVEVKKDHK